MGGDVNLGKIFDGWKFTLTCCMSESWSNFWVINQGYLIAIKGTVSLADVMSKMLISGSSLWRGRKRRKCDGLILRRCFSNSHSNSIVRLRTAARSPTDPSSAARERSFQAEKIDVERTSTESLVLTFLARETESKFQTRDYQVSSHQDSPLHCGHNST